MNAVFAQRAQDAVIVAAVRTAAGKAGIGSLANVRAEDMGKAVIEGILARAPSLPAEEIEDIIIGCAMPEGEQGLNMARVIALHAGLPPAIPAVTINRRCASGLQSIAYAAERIRLGEASVILAGGVESMSHVPMMGWRPSPHPELVDAMPEVYMAMGHAAEIVARRYDVTREEQDQFAVVSHQKAAWAIASGVLEEEIVPLIVKRPIVNRHGHYIERSFEFAQDEGVRATTSLQALSQLKPAFAAKGTVTAGNSSQMSDGAAALLLMSRAKANALGLKPLAAFRHYAVAGVAPEVMGIGPIKAIPLLMKKAGLTTDQIDLFELNEAFAAQCIPVIRELKLPIERINVNGGAIALGHPLGCTGSKLSVTLIHELARRGGGLGVVSMCVGGGMGAAGLIEVYPG
ncbi:acetyl-CoA C-acyltransferase [Paenibacillus septentrionalis]|uniref:acetyl-CoA C-acyltransferase n=1 Tax=Paenibacillus septentrionalis TaxID=429342 RepID=A0ABW1V492_9BACL